MLLADPDPGHVEDSNDTNIMQFLRRRTATVVVFYAEILQFFSVYPCNKDIRWLAQ